MRRVVVHGAQPAEASNLAGALEALDAEDLRELLREMLPQLDEAAGTRMVDELVARAARKGTGWEPEGPDEAAVTEVLSFAQTAKRTHYGPPHTVDRFLRRGACAFLRRDYEAARRIFHALLPPIAVADIDCGQDEMVDEVLAVDVAECAAQYVVAMYMTTAPEQRAEVVRAALLATGDLGRFREPLAEMETAAVEPLPGLRDFLPRWRSLVEQEVADGAVRRSWGPDGDCWLREVVWRLEGTDGLAARARATRGGADLRAWCRALVEARDWKAALAAFEEAAAGVRDTESRWRGEFLDGVALAAQELGRRDLPARLERAWRAEPTLLRLRRWLGAARTAARARKIAVEALAACPQRDERQRAVLHLVAGDFESAAKGLSKAPGLGWSSWEHPGHLVFALFVGLLESGDAGAEGGRRAPLAGALALDDWEMPPVDPNQPRLHAPEVTSILETAGVQGPVGGEAGAALLAGMRKAAEKRVAGVTQKQRHRYYGHAAELVALCVSLDPSPAGGRWLAGLRSRFSRYPAMQRELTERLGRPQQG